MKKGIAYIKDYNLIVPVVVLLLLAGYIVFSSLIFHSILENQRTVSDLQVSYYRLELFETRAEVQEHPEISAAEVNRRGEQFIESVIRLWSRPFFEKMREADPELDALLQDILHQATIYTSSSLEKRDNSAEYAHKRAIERDLEALHDYIHEYGNTQLSTLWLANIFIGIVYVLYTVVLFTLMLRNRYSTAVEKRVRAMGRAYIHRLEVTKKHIAYDIHDRVIQELGTARIGLRKALEQHADAHREIAAVEEVLSSLDFSIDTLREIINGIQQWDVRVYSLKQALRHLADEVSAQVDFSITLKTGGLGAVKLSEEQKAQILAIVHEALTNIRKHADADTAVISAVAVGSRVEVRVRDNGKGFSADLISLESGVQHIGLVSMEERARLIGGGLSIRSRPKRGTVVRLSVPLPS